MEQSMSSTTGFTTKASGIGAYGEVPPLRAKNTDLSATEPDAPQAAAPKKRGRKPKAATEQKDTAVDSAKKEATATAPAKKTRVKGHPHKTSMSSEETKAAIRKDLSGGTVIYESNKPHVVRGRARKEGSAVWLELSEKLLNKKGKAIVSDDPSLGEKTMKKLLKAHPPEGDHPFYFWDEDGTPGTGVTVISTCIDDNPRQSMAELIARYADLRKVPFTDTAIACLELYKKNGDMFVHYICVNGTYLVEPWTPPANGFPQPPKKRRSSANG